MLICGRFFTLPSVCLLLKHFLKMPGTLACLNWSRFRVIVSIVPVCCCDWKSRAASAQSCALWQQATIEITCHDHSISACSCRIYVGVNLRAHPLRGESHIQRNANWEVAIQPRFPPSIESTL